MARKAKLVNKNPARVPGSNPGKPPRKTPSATDAEPSKGRKRAATAAKPGLAEPGATSGAAVPMKKGPQAARRRATVRQAATGNGIFESADGRNAIFTPKPKKRRNAATGYRRASH